MTADRTRFRSTRSSESSSKKTPVTDIFDDHHHERISGSRSRNHFSAAFFGLMEERKALPKQLSTREKSGCQDRSAILSNVRYYGRNIVEFHTSTSAHELIRREPNEVGGQNKLSIE